MVGYPKNLAAQPEVAANASGVATNSGDIASNIANINTNTSDLGDLGAAHDEHKARSENFTEAALDTYHLANANGDVYSSLNNFTTTPNDPTGHVA